MEEDNTQNTSSKENETPSEAPPTTVNNHIEPQNNNNDNNNPELSKDREHIEENSPSNPLKRGRNEFQRGRGNKDDNKKEQYWRNNNPRENRGHSPPNKIPKREHWPERGYHDKGGGYYRGIPFQDRHIIPNRNSPNIPPRGGERRGTKTFDGPLKSFKQFSTDLRDIKNNNKEIEKMYEEYRVEWQRTQTIQFFEEHKNDEWLKEKYHPNYLIEKFKRKNEKCAKLISEFDKEVKSQDKSKWNLDYRESNEMDIEKSQEENKNIETDQINQQNIDYSVVVIKNIPSNITRENIKELLASVENCSVQKLFFSEPNKQKHFTRTAFVKFEDDIQNEKAKNFLFSKRIGSFEVITSIEKLSQPWKVKTTPSICSSDQRILVDLNQSTNIINILNNEVNITNFSDVLKDSDLLNSLSEKEKLDLNIYYLRKVHHYCYYCATEFDDEFELYRKCASIHLRRKHGETIDPDFENGWIAKLDKTFAERENYFPTATLKNLEEKIVNGKVNEEDVEKSRCILCKKLFRANEFVVKHLYLKHQDAIDEEKEKAINQQYLENYQNDPHKIIAYSHQGRRADSFSPYKNSPQNWRTNTPNYNYNKDGKKQMSPYQNNNNNAKVETRELRSYVDLDTPGEFIPEIDYSTSL